MAATAPSAMIDFADLASQAAAGPDVLVYVKARGIAMAILLHMWMEAKRQWQIHIAVPTTSTTTPTPTPSPTPSPTGYLGSGREAPEALHCVGTVHGELQRQALGRQTTLLLVGADSTTNTPRTSCICIGFGGDPLTSDVHAWRTRARIYTGAFKGASRALLQERP